MKINFTHSISKDNLLLLNSHIISDSFDSNEFKIDSFVTREVKLTDYSQNLKIHEVFGINDLSQIKALIATIRDDNYKTQADNLYRFDLTIGGVYMGKHAHFSLIHCDTFGQVIVIDTPQNQDNNFVSLVLAIALQ